MYVTAETIITAASLLGAIVAFVTLFWKLFKWIEHQKEQDQTIATLSAEVAKVKGDWDTKLEKLRVQHNEDTESIREEQTLIVYGLLACLKGLAGQGCNGPVTEAIGKLEKHINQKAHGQ